MGLPVGKLFDAHVVFLATCSALLPASAAYLYGGPGELTFALGSCVVF